jgi:hypothetical protein
MTSERLGLWLSLLANAGVLLGLILVVVEIRHNTQATEALLHQDVLAYARDHTELLVGDENERLAEIVFRGEVDPDSLSPDPLEKFILFTAYRMGAWESSFVHHDEGLLSTRSWELFNSWYSALLSKSTSIRPSPTSPESPDAARTPPNKALQLTSAMRGVLRQRRPELAPLAGRLEPSGGGAP